MKTIIHAPSKATMAALCTLPLLCFANSASAQISNAPYSFNKGAGSGMSLGGRQAIINEKLYREHPDNIVRSANGELLDVTKGPGDSAFVSYSGTGNIIAPYRGIGFSYGSPLMSAGAFNYFFAPTASTYYTAYSAPARLSSWASVSTWTSSVTSGAPVSFTQGDTVDGWTGQAWMLRVSAY